MFTQRQQYWLALVAVVLTLLAGAWLPTLKITPDSDQYVLMAQGRISEVERPFAPRVLHPALVAGIANATSVSLDQAFAGIGVVALLAFVAGLMLAVAGQPHPLPMLTLAVLTPAMLNLYRSIYSHDLLYAALLAWLFWALARRQRGWALLLLALLFLTRESTYLLSVCLIGLAWRRRERALAAGAVAITMIGLLLASNFAALAKPSLHGLNPLLYTASRLPINFAWNVLGVPLLSNTSEAFWRETNPAVLEFCATPAATIEVPPSLPVGGIRTVKICGFFAENPLNTLGLILTTFGIAPALLLAAWRRPTGRPKSKSQALHSLPLGSWPLATQLAIVYGLISFVLAPMLGNTVGRYVAYAWPLFWLTLPHLHTPRKTPRPTLLIACHLVLLGMGLVMTLTPLPPLWLGGVVTAALLAQIMAFQLSIDR